MSAAEELLRWRASLPDEAELSCDEAARFLGVSRRTLDRWSGDSRVDIPFRVHGRNRRRYRVRDLRTYLSRGSK